MFTAVTGPSSGHGGGVTADAPACETGRFAFSGLEPGRFRCPSPSPESARILAIDPPSAGYPFPAHISTEYRVEHGSVAPTGEVCSFDKSDVAVLSSNCAHPTPPESETKKATAERPSKGPLHGRPLSPAPYQWRRLSQANPFASQAELLPGGRGSVC